VNCAKTSRCPILEWAILGDLAALLTSMLEVAPRDSIVRWTEMHR